MRTGFLCLSTVLALFTSCEKVKDYLPDHHHSKKDLGNFKQVNLVANNEFFGARRTDPKLLNAWGISFSASGTPWISSTGGGVSVVYDREGGEYC